MWENEVNELMLKQYGVGVDDIPDMPWGDWFRAKVAVAKAVQKAIDETNKGGF